MKRRTTMTRALALAAAMLGCRALAAASAPPVRVVTSFDRAIATVGDTIRYTVSIDHAADVEVKFPEFPETIAGFMVTQFGNIEKHSSNGRVRESRWYDLRHFLAGAYTIPGVAVEYRVPGKPKAMLRSAALFVQIESMVGGEDTDIRDIQEPLHVASRYTKYYLWGGAAALALIVAAVAGMAYYSRRVKGLLTGPPPVPAHELAYAELEQLLKLGLIDAGKIKEFYYRLSNIVRHYIENRFSIMAPERTTEEFLVEMSRTQALSDSHKGLVADFLGHCDLVKYAKFAPTGDQIKATCDSAMRFIDETKETAADAA